MIVVEYVVYMLALAIIAIISLAAIVHPQFNDNFLQRLGLAVAAFGAILRMWTLHTGEDSQPLRYLLTYGIAVYALGTALKWRGFNRVDRTQRRRTNDLRANNKTSPGHRS